MGVRVPPFAPHNLQRSPFQRFSGCAHLADFRGWLIIAATAVEEDLDIAFATFIELCEVSNAAQELPSQIGTLTYVGNCGESRNQTIAGAATTS